MTIYHKIDEISDIKQFNISSGKILVTDPCYSTNANCLCKLNKVSNGKWNTKVAYHRDADDLISIRKYLDYLEEDVIFNAKEIEKYKNYKGRVVYIHAWHESCCFDDLRLNEYIEEKIFVGVDSGQAGFFDYEKYSESHQGIDSEELRESEYFNKFYKEVCDLTLGNDSFGVIDYGAVSSS